MFLLDAVEPVALEVVPLVVEELLARDQPGLDLRDARPRHAQPVGHARVDLKMRARSVSRFGCPFYNFFFLPGGFW